MCFPGNPPVLIKNLWWWEADYADSIRKAISKYAGNAALADTLMAGDETDDRDDDYDEPESISDAQAYL